MRTTFLAIVFTSLILPVSTLAQERDQSDLHVVRLGAGDRVIVMLHGGPGIRHNYLRPEWDALATEGRLIYYDQRGCGLSTPEGPHSWEQHVEDLHGLVRRESVGSRVTIAASSWGTLLALMYARSYPATVSELVLSGLPPWPDAEQVAAFLSEMPQEQQELFRNLSSGSSTSDWMLDSATVANSGAFHPALGPRVGATCTGAGRATYFSLATLFPADSLRTVTVPVLIVRGPDADPSVDGARSLADLLPNATLTELEATGHNPWADDPTRFFEAVRKFLTRK